MPTTAASELDRLLGDALALVAASDRQPLQLARLALRQPLQVAVAGRVSAGKSTLVNALLGRRISPTGGTETTRVVARFQHSHEERVEAVLASGERLALGFEDRMLPADLGVDPDEVDHLDVAVTTANGILGPMSLVDTPGLGSLVQPAADRRSRAAMARAEALVFLVNETLHEDELATVDSFRATNPGATAASSALGVLSRVDLIDAPDPMAEARTLAAEHLHAAGGALAAVVPLMGKLAETANRGGLLESDVRQLQLIAELPPQVRRRALRSHEFLRRAELPVAPAARERLLDLLDISGIALAVEFLDGAGPTTGAAALREHLRAISGFDGLDGQLREGFVANAEALKARQALRALRQVAVAPAPDGAGAAWSELRDRIELALRRPSIQRLALIELAAEARAGRVRLTPSLTADLERMARAGSPAARVGASTGDGDAIGAAVADGRRRWSTIAVSGNLRQRAVAEQMVLAYANAQAELQAHDGTGAPR